MATQMQLTAVVEREGDGYVSLCPELDVASQGDTIEEARANLVEAVELFLEGADDSEKRVRLTGEIYLPPDAGVDENVSDIQQGVAIILAVKRPA